jgi:hypothetical protein
MNVEQNLLEGPESVGAREKSSEAQRSQLLIPNRVEPPGSVREEGGSRYARPVVWTGLHSNMGDSMKNRPSIIGFSTWAVAMAILCLVLPIRATAFQTSQEQTPGAMPGMDMSKAGSGPSANAEAAKGADMAMSGHDMDMGPHMFMTSPRPANAGDEKRAAGIVAELRPAIEKYKDYKVALADGFKIFLPDVPQPHYHFTNYEYAREAQSSFNPAHPTSLLYEKTQDGYVLQGAMYTAPRFYTEADLDARVPLSVARWHEHVNLCFAPKDAQVPPGSSKEFGFHGSISTAEACQQAGGRWMAQIFNWMVHVYPYETDPEKVWAH